MPRTKLVVGNWKMFTDARSGRELAAAVAKGCAGVMGVRVAVCPPFPYLAGIAELLAGSGVALGAQNVYPAKEGAFTGEVSPGMLKDIGCEYVIVGHSERRHVLGEQDAFINRKVSAALDAGLNVILCIGETLAERNAGETESVLKRQLLAWLTGVSPAGADRRVYRQTMAKKTPSSGKTPWERKRPAGAKKTKLTAASRAKAKGRARKAGRKYPNLVDNMRAATEQRSRKKAASGATRKTSGRKRKTSSAKRKPAGARKTSAKKKTAAKRR